MAIDIKNISFESLVEKDRKIKSTENTYQNTPSYYIMYTYQHKSKHVLFDLAYHRDTKLKNAISQLIKEISKTISDAQDRRH